jgi:catechol 2,3-dioxygenase-like lactoylglutathione lyase family enzyme
VQFIIDCKEDPSKADALDAATTFWSRALGMRVVGREGGDYDRLDASARDVHIEVQRVSHESRIHLDIETDDVEAEVCRLEQLGARRVAQVKTWWVMDAPTGQRFCVVRAKKLDGAAGVTVWE